MRTGFIVAAAACLVAGSAWAQSGPQQVATRPGQVTQSMSPAARANARLVRPRVVNTLTPKTGWKTQWATGVFPSNPESNGVKMSASNKLTVDSQAAPNGFYMFAPQARDRGLTDYVQIQLTAKRDHRYDFMCYSIYVNSNGMADSSAGVSLAMAKFEGGVMRSPGLITNRVKQSGPDPLTIHFASYEHKSPNGPVTLRIVSDQGTALNYTLFYGCFVSEVAKVTTYSNQGDKA